MQQIADQASSSASTSPVRSGVSDGPLERQRSALRDLVALASECARREAEINEQFTSLHNANQERYSAIVAALNARFKAQSEDMENKIRAEIDAIEQRYSRKLQAIKDGHKQTCTSIQWDYSAAEKATRSSHDEAKLVIETGLDAAHCRVHHS